MDAPRTYYKLCQVFLSKYLQQKNFRAIVKSNKKFLYAIVAMDSDLPDEIFDEIIIEYVEEEKENIRPKPTKQQFDMISSFYVGKSFSIFVLTKIIYTESISRTQ